MLVITVLFCVLCGRCTFEAFGVISTIMPFPSSSVRGLRRTVVCSRGLDVENVRIGLNTARLFLDCTRGARKSSGAPVRARRGASCMNDRASDVDGVAAARTQYRLSDIDAMFDLQMDRLGNVQGSRL